LNLQHVRARRLRRERAVHTFSHGFVLGDASPEPFVGVDQLGVGITSQLSKSAASCAEKSRLRVDAGMALSDSSGITGHCTTTGGGTGCVETLLQPLVSSISGTSTSHHLGAIARCDSLGFMVDLRSVLLDAGLHRLALAGLLQHLLLVPGHVGVEHLLHPGGAPIFGRRRQLGDLLVVPQRQAGHRRRRRDRAGQRGVGLDGPGYKVEQVHRFAFT
jgi:hypothetical protein